MAGMFPDEFPFTPRREQSWHERVRRHYRPSAARSQQGSQEGEALAPAPRMPPVMMGVVWLPDTFMPPVITTAPASV